MALAVSALNIQTLNPSIRSSVKSCVTVEAEMIRSTDPHLFCVCELMLCTSDPSGGCEGLLNFQTTRNLIIADINTDA